MRIVKVSATTSTNTYLRELNRTLAIDGDILLWTPVQTQGRGQRGNGWESEPFKNLTFSIFHRFPVLGVDQLFYVTMAASLAIYQTLVHLGLNRISVKWPNDIMAGEQKICGILIESVIRDKALMGVIIGVGLNVNQETFKTPRATSIFLKTGREHEVPEILDKVQASFDRLLMKLSPKELPQLKADYEQRLFRKGEISTFKDKLGSFFKGSITGVNKNGLLQVTLEDGRKKNYDLKEVSLIY